MIYWQGKEIPGNETYFTSDIHQGLFYPASPVEIVVSLCLTFSVSVVFFVGAIVGWISVSEIYYSRRTGRKYRDIPAEMSYAPGEQIKGGQE
ncbi:conjugal transfer protein TrbJ [Klebsiella pneumoniae]|nr:conjugal transfer protein TrbJ [Klebsiella pneumoniae]